MTGNFYILDNHRTVCLCPTCCGAAGDPGYGVAVCIDATGREHFAIVEWRSIGDETVRDDGTCSSVPHEQLGPLSPRWRDRVRLAPLRCGRRTKSGNILPGRCRTRRPGMWLASGTRRPRPPTRRAGRSGRVKRAVVRQRRTDHTGRDLVNIVCPRCDGRHWVPVGGTGTCPRRGGAFAIVGARDRKPAVTLRTRPLHHRHRITSVRQIGGPRKESPNMNSHNDIENVTDVLLAGSGWHTVTPGSFTLQDYLSAPGFTFQESMTSAEYPPRPPTLHTVTGPLTSILATRAPAPADTTDVRSHSKQKYRRPR